MGQSSVLAAARAARPTTPVTINGQVFHVMVPTMGAIRAFQQSTEDSEVKVGTLLHECLVLTGDEPQPWWRFWRKRTGRVSLAECREIAGMPWMNAQLMSAIMAASMPGTGDEDGDNPEKKADAG